LFFCFPTVLGPALSRSSIALRSLVFGAAAVAGGTERREGSCIRGVGTSWSVVVHREALLGVSFLLSPRHPVFIALPCLGGTCLYLSNA